MHRAQNEDILLMAPGNYGLDYLKAAYHIHPDQVIKISNFIGDSIDQMCIRDRHSCVEHRISRCCII